MLNNDEKNLEIYISYASFELESSFWPMMTMKYEESLLNNL